MTLNLACPETSLPVLERLKRGLIAALPIARKKINRVVTLLILSASCLQAGLAAAATNVDLSVSAYTWLPDPIIRGGVSTFSINVTNNDASAAASGLNLVVALPPNVDFSSSPTPSGCVFDLLASPQTITCSTSTLAAQAVWPVTFSGRGLATGVQQTTATISATGNTDPNSGNDSLTKNTTVINGANLTVVKIGPANATSGDVISFSLTATNVNGPDVATTFRITDNLPATSDFTYQSSTGTNWSCGASGTTLTCDYSGPNIASGASAPVVTVTGRIITALGTITNGASIASTDSTTGDPDLTNNGPSQVVVTVAPGTSLSAIKTMVSAATGLTTYATGETVNLTLSATNLGPQNATGVAITDVISADFSINSLPSGCSGGTGAGPKTITCTVGALNNGVTYPQGFLIPLTATGAAGNTGTNTANVTRTSPTNGTNTSASVNYTIAAPFGHLTLTKTKTPNPVANGGMITSTIRVTNDSTSTSSVTGTITVTDALGPNETFVDNTDGAWLCSASGSPQTVTCTYDLNLGTGPLARNANLHDIVIRTTATGIAIDSPVTISNTACTGSSISTGQLPLDNVASTCASKSVTASLNHVDLAITKTATPATPTHVLTSDSSFYYTLVVSNGGPDTAPTVNIVDALNAWYSSASAGTTGGSITVDGVDSGSLTGGESCSLGATARCTLKNLVSGGSRTIVITLNRPFNDNNGNPVVNTASVSTPDAIEANVANNSSSANVLIDAIADVAITTMSGAPNPVKVGVTVTFTTSIKNNGANTAAGVVLRQTIDPARMTYVAGSASLTIGGTCSYVSSFSGAPYAGQAGIECSGLSMGGGATGQLSYKVIPVYPYPDSLDATYSSAATITTTTIESDAPTYANNTSSTSITVTTKQLDLTVTDNDTGSDPSPFGSTLVYAITAQNNGPSQATGFKLTVTPIAPPQGSQPSPYTMTFNSASSALPSGATCSVVGSNVVCYMGANQASSVLASGSPQVYHLAFDTGPLSNTPAGSVTYATSAAVESYETGPSPYTGDSLPGNNSVTETTTVLPKTDLHLISKSVSPASPFSLNQPFTYTVVVGNMGPSPAAGVEVTDTLPSGLSVTGAVTATLGSGTLTTNSCSTSGTAAAGIKVTCDLGTLPVASGTGDTNNLVTITIPVKAAYGTYTSSNGFNTNRPNTASIAVLSVAGVPLSYDPDLLNNTSTPVVNVQIQKSSIAGTVYSDNNQNNALDTGEKITSSVTFSLYGKDFWGNDIGTAGSPITVTTSTGDFLFDNLPTADASGYTIVETQPANYYDRLETVGGANGFTYGTAPGSQCDGTINCASSPAANTISGIVLPGNTAATGYIFQEYAKATVSGYVYSDLNNNGQRAASGEPGINVTNGINITLTGTDYTGAPVNLSTTTNASGFYTFAAPPSQSATSYTVTEQSQPAGYYDGQEQNGAGNVVASSAGRQLPGSATAESMVIGTVVPNGSYTERDFGELPFASIAGSVFVDSNTNGAKDSGETGGVPNVTITLSGSDYLNNVVCPTAHVPSCTFTTDSSGNYSISNLPPSNGTGYTLTETPPAGMTHTGAQPGSPAGGTGGTGSTAVTITNVALAAGINATGYNFGEFGQALSGYVYVDTNRNGTKDAGEPGIAGVSMTLSGTTIGGVSVCTAIAPNPCTVVTAAGGGYSFASLPQSDASGYTITEQSQAAASLNNYQDGPESVGTVNAVTTGSAAVNDQISGIVIGIGQAGSNYNFGEWAGGLTGRVYYDANDNGSFDGADSGIGSVTLTLSGTTVSGANVCTMLTNQGLNCAITTAADGTFTYNGLPASNGTGYILTETQPVDYADRTNALGTATVAGTLSSGTVTSGIVIGTGVLASGYLFGEKTGAISGAAYIDANNNGIRDSGEAAIPGVTITLSGTTASGAAVCSGAACTTTTAADGSYGFTGLKNANASGYTITEQVQNTAPLNTYLDGKVTPGSNCGACATTTTSPNNIHAIVLNAAQSYSGYNFGELSASSIYGAVYHDANNNNVLNPGEALAGVTLTLSGTDDLGNVVNQTTQTAADGSYDFTNLRPSNGSGYTITETQPAGIGDYSGTTGTQVGTIGGGSVGTAALNVISGIVLPSGASGLLYNFRENASGLSGSVYVDDNGNGIRDAGEIGIPGVTVTLSGAASRTTTTDANGNYSFDGLVAGSYTLTEQAQSTPPLSSYGDGQDKTGTVGGTLGNDVLSAIPLGTSVAATGYLFGEQPSSSLTGVAYLDANNNGIQDGAEVGISGVAITLSGTTTSGLNVCTLVSCAAATDGSGHYAFNGLPSGNYTLVETQPILYQDGMETAGTSGGNVNNTAFDNSALHNSITSIPLSGGVAGTGYNFGERSGALATVSGKVWFESSSRNQIQDSGEPGLQGWVVKAYQGGVERGSAITAADGTYSMSGLATATGYEIRFYEAGNSALFGDPLSQDTTYNTTYGAPATTGHTIQGLTLYSGANIINQNLPLDPSGVVYDSITRLPVSGATVTLVGPGNFDPATELAGGTGNATQVTNASGFYQFLLLSGAPAGTYTLQITQPGGYIPPPSAIIPPTSGPYTPPNGGGNSPIQAQAIPPTGAQATTYYLSFNLTPGTSANVINNHIPLDPILGGAIVMTKTSPLVNVSRGDLVPYTITATNTLNATLSNIDVRDQVPPGFKYKAGTATLDGTPREPTISGRILTWPNLTFAAKQRRELRMMLVVGAGVSEGEYVNSVFALNNIVGAAVSNTATATVRVVPDPTFDCSDLIGKVFDDKNANGYEDEGEPGIPNVRLATVNGLLVTTDAEGRFHVTCAMVPNEWRGSNFIMKLDERTLPTGFRVTTENPRDVRLTSGKMSKLNFGATIHRVVRLDVTDAAFEADALKPEWQAQIEKLPETLKDQPSVLRLAYKQGADGADAAKKRLQAISAHLRALWEQKQCCHLLQIEEELIQPAAAKREGQ